MIVIDVGCAKYGGDESIPYLIEEFRPATLYGFDPSSSVEDDEYPYEWSGRDGWTNVVIRNAAAWTHPHGVHFDGQGLGGHVVPSGGRRVESVDLASFITTLPADELVLKMDAEGAEYELLPYLISEGIDLRIKLAWVEWHPFGPAGRDKLVVYRRNIEASIRCELVEWTR